MQMRSDKIFGDLFMHIYCRVRWWKNFIFGRYLAKLYTRVYSVSISDVLFDQQLLPRNLLHTCHTLCLKKYRLTLDVWQWLLKMWTDFQNSFTIWFVWKFSMYKPQINSKIKKKYYRISTFNVNLPQIYNFIHLCVLRICCCGCCKFSRDLSIVLLAMSRLQLAYVLLSVISTQLLSSASDVGRSSFDNAVCYLHCVPTRSSAVAERPRATLLVIEYFAKSLKITQGHSKWHWCVELV